jgi:hypothetical protein
MNECIVREVGGWPSCVITCEIDCLKILCVPTPIDPWFGLGGYSLSHGWVASFFFLIIFLGGYSLLSQEWRELFVFLRPIGGRDLFLQTFQKDGKNFFNFFLKILKIARPNVHNNKQQMT